MSVAMSLAKYVTRVVSSIPPWGVLEVTSPVRYGWRSFRLTVYPPGTSSAERRVLWLDRHLPVVAAAGVLAAMLIAVPVVPPLILLMLIPVGVAIIGVVRRATRPLRQTVRTLRVAQVDLRGSTETYGDECLLSHCVDELREMDRARLADQITPVEYERRWGDVYDALAAEEYREK